MKDKNTVLGILVILPCDECQEKPRGNISNGPAQVATDNYRKNYDIIFGKKQPFGQA